MSSFYLIYQSHIGLIIKHLKDWVFLLDFIEGVG